MTWATRSMGASESAPITWNRNTVDGSRGKPGFGVQLSGVPASPITCKLLNLVKGVLSPAVGEGGVWGRWHYEDLRTSCTWACFVQRGPSLNATQEPQLFSLELRFEMPSWREAGEEKKTKQPHLSLKQPSEAHLA